LVFKNQSDLFASASFIAHIKNYLRNGGIVVAINDTNNNNDPNFNEIFNLTPSGGSAGTLKFLEFKPEKDRIAKYFLGFGFDVATPIQTVNNFRQGTWWIWETPKLVTANQTHVFIEGFSQPFVERSIFTLSGPDSSYRFRIKKILYPDKVEINPLDTTFSFRNFIESNEKFVRGNNILTASQNFGALTTNNSAIWMSDFKRRSDEYRTLIKAAIASRKTEWTSKDSDLTKPTVKVSSFISLCCDMPEIVEYILVLWYKF